VHFHELSLQNLVFLCDDVSLSNNVEEFMKNHTLLSKFVPGIFVGLGPLLAALTKNYCLIAVMEGSPFYFYLLLHPLYFDH
jgi:hypothetical protein